MKCDVGDIVLVNNFKYPDGRDGSLHAFVVMDISMDEFEIINLDYLCFLVSSNMGKSNTVNGNYPYNEPIMPTEDNGLKVPSHVKCDILYETIKEDDIFMRVGIITKEQYEKFMELFRQSQGDK